MSIKPFRASIIKKASRNKIFKDIKHRDELAREAGERGFSNLQMERKLKEMGYDPKRRKAVISHILGGKETEMDDTKLNVENISELTKEDISKLPWEERERIKKIKKIMVKRNIISSTYSKKEADRYIKAKGGLGIQSQQGDTRAGLVSTFKKDVEAREGFARKTGKDILNSIKKESTEQRLNVLGYEERGRARKSFAGNLPKKKSAPSPSTKFKPPTTGGKNIGLARLG